MAVDPWGVLSLCVVLLCVLIIARFIARIGVDPRQAMLHSDNYSRREIPSRSMVGVRNPFSLELKTQSGSSTKPGEIKFQLSTKVPCYVTFYWEVTKDLLEAALSKDENQEGSVFEDNQSDSSDSDLREVPIMSAIPLEHILRGSYQDRGTSEFYDSSSDHEILAEPPPDLETTSQKTSTSPVSSKHSLVVTIEMSRNDEMGPQKLSEIVALITAAQVSHSQSGKLVCNITMQCVQTAEGKLYSLKKLFIIESDINSDTQSSPPHQDAQLGNQSPSSPPEDVNLPTSPSDLINAMCIVCSALPVSRAFLPCRHACVCGSCFNYLNCCPMCRGLIHSFFKVQDEPYLDNTDHDCSAELNRMSVGEVLRGVWSAS